MKTTNGVNFGLIILTIIPCVVAAKSVAKDREIEVKLQFLEYELEDLCVSKNEEEWKFLNGSEPDLKKFLEVEMKESDFYKRELEVLQKHMGKKFSHKKLQRLMDLFSHPGAPLLGSAEFREYRDYTRRLQEITTTTTIPCSISEDNAASDSKSTSSDSEGHCDTVDVRKINKLLYVEKDEDKLEDWWRRWFRTLEEKNQKTKYDFVQQLSILDLEAEQNGEEELNEYWLKQADITWVDYESVQNLWEEILPLYEKLKQYMRSLVVQNYGKNVLRNEIIPVHVLGSLESHDWITAADKLGGFDGSEDYRSIKHFLKLKTAEDLWKMADNQTGELKLGHLPQSFYEKSSFHQSSGTCQNRVMDYCERQNVLRVMFCAAETPSVKSYIQINEHVMKMKYLLLSGKEEEENGYLFREGPRDSVLHEAMEGLSSLRALWPEHLERKELIANHGQRQTKMLTLLLTALHVIPPLPYYLASDLWRINALRQIDATVGENVDTTTLSTFSSSTHSTKGEAANEAVEEPKKSAAEGGNAQESHIDSGTELNEPSKVYDTQNLTREWWNYREQYQGVGSPDGKLYEDYLQDRKIIWNKSYISKFLGKILQFQILEKSKNLTDNLSKIQSILQRGKSEPWQFLVEETFNITEISTKPLINYFKPIEGFLEKRTRLKNQTEFFNLNDLNFVSQGFSLNRISNETEGEKPAEGSDALFFSLAVIAAVGIVAFIVTVGRRRYKRRQRTRERKRRLAEL